MAAALLSFVSFPGRATLSLCHTRYDQFEQYRITLMPLVATLWQRLIKSRKSRQKQDCWTTKDFICWLSPAEEGTLCKWCEWGVLLFCFFLQFFFMPIVVVVQCEVQWRCIFCMNYVHCVQLALSSSQLYWSWCSDLEQLLYPCHVGWAKISTNCRCCSLVQNSCKSSLWS